MPWIWLISYFFGGVFAENAIPHLVSGLTGRAFQSPFAKPPGKGLSSSKVNVLWGVTNLAIAYLFVARVGAFDWKATLDVCAFGLGFLLKGMGSAHHFGKFHGGNSPTTESHP